MGKPITRDTPAPTGLSATLEIDGSCPANPGPMGIGYLIHLDESPVIRVGLRFTPGTNNQAEYLGLIFALRHALRLGVTHAKVFMDSQLVVNQVNGTWTCRDYHLQVLHTEAVGLRQLFSRLELKHICRDDNADADYLSKNPTYLDPHPADLEINLTGPRTRKLTRQQAAMIRWWWKTRRCQNECRLARIFNGTPSHMGRIGKGKQYRDVTESDLPHEEMTYAIRE